MASQPRLWIAGLSKFRKRAPSRRRTIVHLKRRTDGFTERKPTSPNGGRYFKAYKPHKAACNETAIANILNRKFSQTEAKRFVVSDFTYVKVRNQWHYICVLVDLFNREIIGHSAGLHKDAALVSRVFATVKGDLCQIQWFHTDRGSEFKNQKMDEILNTFNIGRSLSMKGCPYDNAVAEATFKVMKT